MIALLRDKIDRFFGGGTASTSVPVMDGPLQPNDRIETASLVAAAQELDNLVISSGALHFSSGNVLLRLGKDGTQEQVATFEAAISCLAAYDAALAVGVDGAGLAIRGGRHDGRRIDQLGGAQHVCPSAALFIDDDTLILASGSDKHPVSRWKHDLMDLGHGGSLWRIDLTSGQPTKLGDDLAFPYGLAHGPEGKLVFTEAWRHRVMEMDLGGGVPRVALGSLPGYPGRIIPASAGGYWLACFVPRNQLVEFVLREPHYRAQMMAEIAPDLWVAPSLSSNLSFREPLQGGGVRQMGILKPWAPLRSFGLVIRLDRGFGVTDSYHSRADGRRHGVTSLVEHGSQLVVGSKGKGEAVAIEIAAKGAT